MTEKMEYTLRPYNKNDESAIIELLQSNIGGTSYDQWTWKYKLNPNFDPSLIVVAEKNGQIIGCLTTTVQKLKISRSIIVKSIGSPAEIIVHPKYRRHNIGKNLALKLFEYAKNRKFVTTYGFASPEVFQFFWKRVVNAVSIPSSTVVYTKHLNHQFMSRIIAKTNKLLTLDKRLCKINIAITFKLQGIPYFTFIVSNSKLKLINGQIKTPNITIEDQYGIIRSLTRNKKLSLLLIIKAVLNRNLKLKGVIKKLSVLFLCLRVLIQHYRSI